MATIYQPEEDHLHTPLVDSLIKFDSLCERISEDIETLKAQIDNLMDYRAKMGGQEDTKSMRIRMHDEINRGNELINHIIQLLKEVSEMEFKRKKDIENFNKMIRRLNHTFDVCHEQFTKVLKEIHSREKIFLELKRSMVLVSNASEASVTFTNESNAAPSIEDQESLEEASNNLEFMANIIEQRSIDTIRSRRLGIERDSSPIDEEINMQAQGDGEVLVLDPVSTVEQDRRRKAREKKKVTIRNLIVCVLVAAASISVAIALYMSEDL